ncbi:hypothetical protein [Gandjariella thermophila]|uniref:Uncharacterized protein n=1 Tax=Gandjariella thermophila TaxID=1931992 RepID=A0A4D4JCQ5_9PSEU|nr:hypothetical protein [Gandjariella thermophila]GDY32438.1 hypothetical protein GTS_40710 [Gandjariella thermophila]
MLVVDWLLVLPMFILLIGLLRWAFGDDRSIGPLPDDGDGSGYGLLREVASAPTRSAAERLRTEGVRATTAPSGDGAGCRVLVFPDDEVAARLVLHDER